MRNNRLLIIALVLIVIGVSGVFTISLSDQQSGHIVAMNGMDGCMMNRGQMRNMMQRMMPGMLPPGVKAENLPDANSRGAKLLAYYCSQCHNLPSPAMHTSQEWPSVNNRMFARMSMMSGMMGIENPSPEEQGMIVAYLKSNAIKSISPSALPSPESPAAILFRDTCSQCHALPDPSLHTPSEWPAVVERMRQNMEAMGKRVISDEEKREIVGYLTKKK